MMLSREAQADLLALLGPERAFFDDATRTLYASDETPRSCTPEAVLFPARHDDVAALVALANRHRFALVARGAGSGNLGGAVPVPGGVVVSFECMNRILEFDPANRLMVVETGVVTDDIDALAASAGLMYAPDPGSGAYSRIGGNLATNAAGPRCVKYGATRDHVLGLRAVAGDGRELKVGSRTSKYATAYDLSRLLVGSEGTLALITEATLRLVPAPETVATLRVCYADNAAACAAVVRIMARPVVPCALEFMDSRSIEAIREYGGAEGLPEGTRAVLMVEADGDHDDVPRQIAALEQALAGAGMLEIQSGFAAADIKRLWTARKSLSLAVKNIAPLKINEGRGGAGGPPGQSGERHRRPGPPPPGAHRQLRPRRQRQPACQPHGAWRRRRRDGPRPRLSRRPGGSRAGPGRQPVRRARHRFREAAFRGPGTGCRHPGHDAGREAPVRPERHPQSRQEAAGRNLSRAGAPCTGSPWP
jgi:D-lactate dehydrogenase